jgi:3-hydroxyisobutyrate dehydrogenase-like beta-hydroxyacid dehydrogenase
MSSSIGFIGLGAMGLPMALNLLSEQPGLKVWNRNKEKAKSLIDLGAEPAASPSDCCTLGGIVISMVSDDQALMDISSGPRGIIGALGPGGIHISCSTVAPSTLKTLAERHAALGEALVAAPVFGRPDAAAARKLWILLSGPKAATERAADLLAPLGQGIHHLGDSIEAAAAMKLAGNFMILSAVESMGEAMMMAQRYGVDREGFADFFGRTLFAGPIYQNYGKQIATRRYHPAGFKLPLGLKDMRLVTQSAGAVNVPMPLADLLRNRLLESMAKKREEYDWTALELTIAEAAGESFDVKK